MKISVQLIAIVLLLAASGCTKKLDTDKKRATYAIGQQISENLKRQNIDVDPEILAMSIKDGLKGDSRLTPEEMQQALLKLQEETSKVLLAKAEENKKVANEFLIKNKTVAGVKTTATGLQYLVETEGSGRSPLKTEKVRAKYKAALLNGTVFEAANEPVEFPIQGLVPGWSEAFQLMKPGAKYKFFIPPELAYGSAARGNLPANSVIVMDVELLAIVDSNAKPATVKK